MNQPDIVTLKHKFAVAGQIEFTAEANGMVVARITNSHAQSAIALQGAHIMAFQPNGEAPLIWLSQAAKLTPGKSIRGGVPVCWPWFGAHATESSFPAHGFARTAIWEVASSEALPDGGTRITFELPQDAIPSAQWPHTCRVHLAVTVGKTLAMELVTENTGSEVFEIGEALHTYFAISDLGSIRITGLEDCAYLDKVDGFKRKSQADAITIASEVDRVYVNTEADCLIEDRALKRRIRIAKHGSRSTVVWNPWIEKSAKMGDFGSDTGYRGMVCVETANAAENVVSVAPGTIHLLRVVYGTEAM